MAPPLQALSTTAYGGGLGLSAAARAWLPRRERQDRSLLLFLLLTCRRPSLPSVRTGGSPPEGETRQVAAPISSAHMLAKNSPAYESSPKTHKLILSPPPGEMSRRSRDREGYPAYEFYEQMCSKLPQAICRHKRVSALPHPSGGDVKQSADCLTERANHAHALLPAPSRRGPSSPSPLHHQSEDWQA